MAIQQSETSRIQMILRRIFLFFLAALIFCSCGKDDVPTPVKPTAHTFLLYMPGRDLLKYYNENIEGIERAVNANIPGNGRILVCYQPVSYDEATLFEIYYNPKQRKSVRKELKVYTNFQAGEVASVQQVFADVQQYASAESYGLTIGCHGLGWVPTGSPLPRSHMKQPEMDGILKTRSTRYFGDRDHELNIGQLAEAVAGLPYRFDYLIFDDCFMANIETLYDLRNSFDYIIGSPCEIIATGFPYDRTIPCLFANEGPDLVRVCYEFWDFYNSQSGQSRSGCISLAVMSELDALADVVAEIHAGQPASYDPSELQYYERYTSHVFYDLGDYINKICTDRTLYERFEQQLAQAFPEKARLHTPSFYSRFYGGGLTPITFYSGVTTSEPSLQFTDQHKETSWYRRTHRLE